MAKRNIGINPVTERAGPPTPRSTPPTRGDGGSSFLAGLIVGVMAGGIGVGIWHVQNQPPEPIPVVCPKPPQIACPPAPVCPKPAPEKVCPIIKPEPMPHRHHRHHPRHRQCPGGYSYGGHGWCWPVWRY